MDRKTVDELRRAGLVSEEQGAALSALADVPTEELGALERHLSTAGERVLQPHGDPLVVGTTIADVLDEVRAESARREADASSEPTVAAGQPARQRPTPAEVARRRPERSPLRSPAVTRRAHATITAGADSSEHAPGAEMTPEELARAFVSRVESMRRQRVPAGRRFTVATVRANYPIERRLSTLDPERNSRLVNAVVGPEALTAAGGLCAPVEADYSLMVVAVPDRPVRDALARFNAERGGIRFIAPPQLTDLASGVDVITETEDTNNATKPVVVISCGTETEELVHAVTLRIRTGNWNQRFFPEQFMAWYELGLAEFGREADTELLARITTGSTAITDGQNLGAARDVLESYGRFASQYRNRHRMRHDATVQVLLPAWFQDMMQADFLRQIPGDDKTRITREEINALFAARNIAASWYYDDAGATVMTYGTQGAGAGLGWKATVVGFMFAPGTWLHLDGGTLDLGTEVRDTTRNERNEVEAFFEGWEGTAKVGVESLKITNTVCATGEVAATVDVACGAS